jgi:acyl dehydratase
MTNPVSINGIPELKNHLGVSLGPGAWFTVDQNRIDRFADATGDRQWIHTDPERARQDSPFGQTVAHGYLTLALLPVLLPDLLDIQNVSMVINYGIERLRFPSPVPAGSRLRLHAKIKNFRELASGAARVAVGFQFELENGTKPACTGEVVYVYYP